MSDPQDGMKQKSKMTENYELKNIEIVLLMKIAKLNQETAQNTNNNQQLLQWTFSGMFPAMLIIHYR